jgi:hypothetical protein
VALAAGCAGGGGVPIRSGPGAAGTGVAGAEETGAGGGPTASAPAEIEILADINEVTRPYRQIGYVETQRTRRPGEAPVRVKDLLPELVERARKLGAHALIELETQPLKEGSGSGLRATAIAIVYTD